jgi:RNA polymerase sigma factor (sigma-70 family)
MECLQAFLFHKTLFKVKKLTLGEIVDGIKKRDNKVLTIIYKNLFPGISNYVINHGGNADDAKDVFQESVIIIFRQIEDNSIDIKTGFENYLYGIARYVWLNMLRNKDIHNRNINQVEEPEIEYNPFEEIIDDEIELRIFRKHFLEMGIECQKILKLSVNGVSNKTIAEMLEYKNEQVVSNLKHKFREKLLLRIRKDPEYIKLLKDRCS